jgi:hypothetical protein
MRFGNVFICRGKQGLKIFREHKLRIIFDPEKETDNCMGKYLYILQQLNEEGCAGHVPLMGA